MLKTKIILPPLSFFFIKCRLKISQSKEDCRTALRELDVYSSGSHPLIFVLRKKRIELTDLLKNLSNANLMLCHGLPDFTLTNLRSVPSEPLQSGKTCYMLWLMSVFVMGTWF